jgi:hypothetical protein
MKNNEWVKPIKKHKIIPYFGFDDLVFEPWDLERPENGLLRASGSFENGKAYSIIFGTLFYSNGIDTYEIMTSDCDEPRGYQTKEEIEEILKNLQE